MGHVETQTGETTVTETAHGGNDRTKNRGFASMTVEQQREIASKGGKAAHKKGTAHEWTSEEARQAGRKGGQASRGGRGKTATSNT